MTTFTPRAWQPLPAPPLADDLEKNDALASADLWATPGVGPEDVIVDAGGSAIGGLEDGRIVRTNGTNDVEEIANVGGRPLGIEWLDDGVMVVCNADLGLQRVTVSGEVSTLARGFEGTDFVFTNNATVQDDGTVYFSDTSTRWTIHEYVADLLEGQPTGRVFALAPDASLSLVTDGLHFANGVALDTKQESLFIAETGTYRVHRHWLKGERRGETELFLDNLAGFPDNLTFGNGILWVSMASPRQAIIDMMLPRPWMRRLSYKMPEALKPKPLRHGIILGYDTDGRLVHNLQDSTGSVAITTSARYDDGRLFIGSLTEPHIAVYEL
ncbi:MAG: SMP-30/gluconolactonase/LRE family protein [Acidimicrobiia bacterium]